MKEKLATRMRRKVWAWGGILLFMGGMHTAQAATIDEIMISPPNPTASDEIQVYVRGVHANGCFPREPQVSISGREIHVHFTWPPKPPAGSFNECVLVETAWSAHVPILHGFNAYDGENQVIVSWEETGGELARTTFVVRGKRVVGGQPTGLTTRRILCKNLTTGKKKVIRGDVGTWDCEAAGLKVNPGDKIEQRIIGTAKGICLYPYTYQDCP